MGMSCKLTLNWCKKTVSQTVPPVFYVSILTLKEDLTMSNMKTEVVVVRLTKHERALLDTVKTKPLLADWLKEIAMAEAKQRKNKEA